MSILINYAGGGAESNWRHRGRGDHIRCNENEQFAFAMAFYTTAKECSDDGELAQPRHAHDIGALVLSKNTTDGYGSSIFNLYLGLHVLGVDGRAGQSFCA